MMVDICLNENLSAFLSAKYVCLPLQLQLHLVEDVGRLFFGDFASPADVGLTGDVDNCERYSQ